MHKSGSVLLVVLFLLSVLTIIGFTVVRNTTFLLDGSLSYARSEKQYRATEALLLYGIAIAKSQFKQMQESKSYIFDSWPTHSDDYSALLQINPNQTETIINAQLKKDDKVCCSLSCKLLSNEGDFTIQNWKIGL